MNSTQYTIEILKLLNNLDAERHYLTALYLLASIPNNRLNALIEWRLIDDRINQLNLTSNASN